ncbi:MAG: hypothetical protein H7A21_18250 [Spirochaetales bacterium]|nr:hypothetical protein [Leptospiraceae bacterium]MCP5483383.1 hypothetical protein [Spirochaetales bacterium]
MFLPARVPELHGPAHSALIFVLSFFLTLLAVPWPGLRPRDLLVSLIPTCLLGGLALGMARHVSPPAFGAEHGYGDLLKLFFIQGFAVLVGASGLGMRKNQNRPVIRRAARDSEELEAIFSLRQRARQEEGLTYYRYVTMLGLGFALVCEERARVTGVIHGMRLDDLVFLFDLAVEPGMEQQREETLVARTLTRPEVRLGDVRAIVYLKGPQEAHPALIAHGFRAAEPEDQDIREFVGRRFSAPLLEQFPDWSPLAGLVPLIWDPGA